MIAKVNATSHITRAVLYGQDESKGGEILLYKDVDMTATPEEQARDLVKMSGPYKVKAYNIILSLDDKDTEKFRQKSVAERFRIECELIRSFISEMEKRGTNITDCPFVVARHGNTDNEHFHMTVLTTTVDGHHIHDSFIKKNAARAAAKVSEMYELNAAPRALRNEVAHQVAEGRRDWHRRAARQRPVRRSNTMEDIQNRMRRREAIERANRRKAELCRTIERIARECVAENFAERLKEAGMVLCRHKEEWAVTVSVDEGKERTYTFAQLGVDNNLIGPLLEARLESSEKPQRQKEEPKTRRKVRPAPFPSSSRSRSAGGGLLNQHGGSSYTNREWEVGTDGVSDDDWRRGGGLKM